MTYRDWTEDPSLAARYRAWRGTEAGRRVYYYCLEAALQLQQRGIQHYSIQGLMEAARFDYALDVGPDAAGFKINNNYGAYLARELMRSRPQLQGMFRTRRVRA